VPGNPIKLSGTTPATAPPPTLGEHTDAVRRSLAETDGRPQT
jgi:crotonobetainyl-CoA:carnitine CoA-transferase CaiB-like acyl-CoA transferase